jgi:lactoylglutathione lyase
MKINHLNLTVTDVGAAKAFLEKYFEMRGADGGNKNFDVVYDDDGFVLTLMKAGTQVEYPGYFHIGFIQESEERVNKINQRLKEDGFDVEPPQRHHAWTFYVMAPGGFRVEVLA